MPGFLKRSEEGLIEIPNTFLTVEGSVLGMGAGREGRAAGREGRGATRELDPGRFTFPLPLLCVLFSYSARIDSFCQFSNAFSSKSTLLIHRHI